MTETKTEQTTIESVEIEEQEEVEKNKLRHIINPPSNMHIYKIGMTAQQIVDLARRLKLEVVALCGARFIPTQDPADVKETCNACLDIAGIMMDNPPEKE